MLMHADHDDLICIRLPDGQTVSAPATDWLRWRESHQELLEVCRATVIALAGNSAYRGVTDLLERALVKT